MGRSRRVYNVLMKFWPLGKVLYWLGNKPIVGPLVEPLLRAAGDEAIIIPVQEAVRGTGNVVLPYSLLTPLIERASARFLMSECMCRRGENCQVYAHDIGCIFLGNGAMEINPAMGHLVGVDEALTHVGRAMAVGLVPLIVRAAFDNWMLGIPYHRTLAVCFCCDCCCAVRQGLRLGPPVFWDTVVRLPGLSMTVGPACVGCGRCMDVCYVQAISLTNGRVHIGEQCKGCGRCVAACPAGAISLNLADDVDILGHLLARIEQRADAGLPEM